MGEVKWTDEQQQAIVESGSNILVAAAAGSGKTAVLVERIINKVITQNIDIDKILVVTFTNAAASEMRGRILEAIYKKIEENPNDLNMQKQMLLLNKASICTIDAFCLDVLKNNFFEIDISPNIKVGENEEIEIMKQEVLEEIFEEKYEKKEPEFLELISRYSSYTNDTDLKEMILGIYRFIQSDPYPNEWLEERVNDFKWKEDIDFIETEVGKVVEKNILENIDSIIKILKKAYQNVSEEIDLIKYKEALEGDIQKLNYLKDNHKTWDELYDNINFKFNWSNQRKFNSESSKEIKEEAKTIRDKAKEIFDELRGSVVAKSEQLHKEMDGIYEELVALKNLIFEFDDRFMQRKKEKNIVEFNDIEHFALRILLKKNEKGEHEPTEVAKKYMEKYEEIAIDEYQDSNLVQEYILTSISRGNNIFMVGDVKQSIYKFRQARPELFLKKYKEYKLKKEKALENDLKIQLFKNFRSRKNVLDVTNFIFENIMSERLGEIEYNKEEYLNLGANYKKPEEKIDYAGKTELYIIKEDEEMQNDNLDIDNSNCGIENDNCIEKETEQVESSDRADKNSEEIDEELEFIKNTELEAKFVAKKIQQLIQSEYKVYDKKEDKYRNVTYKDIVVLVRTAKEIASLYEKEILSLNMPVFCDAESQYLDTIEIQTIMNVLKIIDNPLQDIPLVSVLRSTIGGFSDDELTSIRLVDKNEKSFYKVLEKAVGKVENGLASKIKKFLEQLLQWKEEERYLSLDELIWKIYNDTGYYNYVSLMQDGELRQANLKLLFEKAKQYEMVSFKGLFNFINFINNLQSKRGNDNMSPAKVIGENDNVIRIMTIHKSKGLEFPVVFLASAGREFFSGSNKEKIKIHQQLGLGPVFLDKKTSAEWNMIQRDVIDFKKNEEMIAEEMRMLYVALTRAKEKLIIVGTLRKTNKKEENIKNDKTLNKLLNDLEEGDKISPHIIKKCKSYLEWIIALQQYKVEKVNELIETKEISKSEVKQFISQDNKEEEDIFQKITNKKAKRNEELEKELKWEYSNQIETTIPTKTSVTKIKEMKIANRKGNIANTVKEDGVVSDNILELNNEVQEDTYIKSFNKVELEMPQFLKENKNISSARKGTLMHLVIQKLDEKREYTMQEIKELVESLVEKEIILKVEAEAVDISKLYQYTKSKLFMELRAAKVVKKEEPFYINIPAKEIYGQEVEENVLVQGIIDLYFVDKNGKINLVDYKTDYYKGEAELINKYKSQLDLYKEALENSLKEKVDKISIYSLFAMKEIIIK